VARSPRLCCWRQSCWSCLRRRPTRPQGTSGIFAIAPEGGTQERIGPKYGYSPSWSADGQKVVFVGYSGEDEMEFDKDIYLMVAVCRTILGPDFGRNRVGSYIV